MENQKSLNPWLFIWFRPRSCLRRMLDFGQKRIVIWLAVVAGFFNGISSLLVRWGKYAQYSSFQKFSVVLSEIFINILIAILYLYLLSWVYRLAGRWLKGKGHYLEVKTAIGWSFYPWIVTAIIGTLAFLTKDPTGQVVLSGLYAVFAIWSFVIFLNLLGEAHRFSTWRALGAFAIMLGIVIVIALIVSILLMMFRTT